MIAAPTPLNDKVDPVRFGASPRTWFEAGSCEKLVLECIVGEFARQGPTQSRRSCPLQIILDGTARYSQCQRNIAGAASATGKPEHLSQLSHGQLSLCRHQCLLVQHEVLDAKVADPGIIFRAKNWPVIDRNRGRLQIGIVAGY